MPPLQSPHSNEWVNQCFVYLIPGSIPSQKSYFGYPYSATSPLLPTPNTYLLVIFCDDMAKANIGGEEAGGEGCQKHL